MAISPNFLPPLTGYDHKFISWMHLWDVNDLDWEPVTRSDFALGGGGGGGVPGGSTTQVQYNNAGAFGGITGATTDGTTLTLVAPVLGTPASATLTNATGLPIASGVSGLGANVATALGVAVGSAGAFVVNGGVLGTPSSGTLTNATGLPVSTGISGLAAGVATFLATPSSANLAAAVTDETGSGLLVFGTAPTLASTVTIGTAAGTTGAVLFRGTTSGTVTLSVADAAGTWTMKLPTADGTNGQVLTTNGAGQTSFTTVSGGSGITIGTTTITSGTSGRILYDNAGIVGEMTTTGSGTVVVLATAPTITGPAIISEVAGSSGLTITGATQTTSFPALAITQTWNAAGVTFDAADLNVTSTASAAASRLLNLRVGGTSQWSVTKAGATTQLGVLSVPNGTSGAPSINFGTATFGFYYVSASGAIVVSGNNPNIAFNGTRLQLRSDGELTWRSGTDATSSTIVGNLLLDGTNTYAFRNTTAAQRLRIYNTFTTVDTAGEWFAIDWATTANVVNLQAVKGSSTGTARVLTISYGGNQASPVAAITIPITSGDITFGGSVFPTGYKSSDGSAGVTAGPFTTITSITVKNGLVTALSGS